MKFCFSVCEYDPLHNGHVYHLKQMDNTGCDAKAVIMSGNFTQRGGVATLDKYTRARHAILAGADIVIELPTVFSTAPAEIFAKGAIKLINEICSEGVLCFGTECGNRQDFFDLAGVAVAESKPFKACLKKNLESGQPYAKAYCSALKEISGYGGAILDNPNSVLGLEYTKAIMASSAKIDVYPVLRQGAGFLDKNAKNGFCSSSAIRSAISSGEVKKLKKYMPGYVFETLPQKLPDIGKLAIYSIMAQSSKNLSQILDCTEGLENRLKVISGTATDYDEFISKLKTKRYTETRLRRICVSNLLSIDGGLVKKCLKTDLYIKILAIKRSRLDLLSEISGALVGKKTKLVTRKSDCSDLGSVASECFGRDVFSNSIYSLVSGTPLNDYEMKIVEL